MEKRQALLGVIKALLILTPIFGLTWGLGLATLLEEVSIVPHYLFTVLNASQVGDTVAGMLFTLLDSLGHCQSLLKEVSRWSRKTQAQEF